jgi:sugar fermentation stimulation protein A
MADVQYIHPNDETDPDFGAALREAKRQGVQVLAVECAVTPGQMRITGPVEVRL